MSTLANQPVGKKRKDGRAPSSRLARFGVPVPPRIVQFFDGPELAAHEHDRAWGLPGWSGDTRLKVKWGAARLDEIHEDASEGHHADGAASRYLPLAAVGSESHMFAVDITTERLAVAFFDHESGYQEWAPDFEAFLGKLLKKGERTPSEKLEKAYEQAGKLNAADQYAGVIALLEPVLAQFPTDLDHGDDARDTLGAAWNLVGIAREKQPDIVGAMAAYQTALALGTDSAGLNICDLYLNDFRDYAKLVEFGEQQRERIYSFGDKYAWFHIRNYLGQAYLLVGRPADAVRAYHQIHTLAVEDPGKVAEAIEGLRELATEHDDADRETIASILAWLDAPKEPLSEYEVAGMRDWWTGLPAAVATAIREALHFEGDPTGDDFARIAQMTSLEVKNAELHELSWVAMLDKLDDLDVEGNAIRDLAPLASLVRLTRLDISENQVTSLRPLAALARLERLSAGENKLEGLEGLEGMRHLSYLHVNEAGLTSVEPLRGLPELDDVTIYSNAIADLSPLAESPRIKQISAFSNPIARGLAALAALPWLESVDAGDETPRADIKALRAASPRVEIDHDYSDDDDDDDEPKAEVARPDPELPEIRQWWRALSDPWRRVFADSLDREARGKAEPPDEALLALVREDSLNVDDRPLPDLAPLARLTRLDYLNVGNTGTVDISPIAALPLLRDLLIRKNPITSLAPLAAARVLEELYVETCRIASLAGLERCFTLREIHAEQNLVDDLAPLGELDQLRWLDFEHNRITSVAPLAKLPNLRRLELGLNHVTDLAPLAACRGLRELEIWANPGVRNAVALVELPQLTRIISHGALPASELAELRHLRPDVVVD